jgi:two-component system cell cycle sensor histidine kinase/response regulator CckA
VAKPKSIRGRARTGKKPSRSQTKKPRRAKTPIRTDDASRRTILVVDDEPQVRSSMRRVLEKLGHNVLEAPTADAAIDLISRTEATVDLVLTDIIMNGMSGRELALRLSIERPNVRLLLMSGYSPDTMRLKDGEIAKFLRKPISIELLRERVTQALSD